MRSLLIWVGVNRTTSCEKSVNKSVIMLEIIQRYSEVPLKEKNKTPVKILGVATPATPAALTPMHAWDTFINRRIECYLSNTIYLSPLTPHVMLCYVYSQNGDRIVAIDSRPMTSLLSVHILKRRVAKCRVLLRPMTGRREERGRIATPFS